MAPGLTFRIVQVPNNSYRAELCALQSCCEAIAGGAVTVPRPTIRICPECRSALQRLARGPAAQTGVPEQQAWQAIARMCTTHNAHCTPQWVPGHAGVTESEIVGKLAKSAARSVRVEQLRGSGVDLRAHRRLGAERQRCCV
eukprot:gene9782-478_t